MKIKWGVIGCGGIADRRTLPGMMLCENAELIAVMDANKDAADRCKEKYNAKYAFDNIEELLALDEIEAVYIASPVFCHKEQAMAAADAKKHILIEKPVGITAAEAKEIAEYCKNKLLEYGADSVYIDSAKNVVFPMNCDGSDNITVFVAHTDTVYPDREPMPYLDDGEFICCR